MRSILIDFWRSVRRSYWFLPALMTSGAAALSVLTSYLDALYLTIGGTWPRWLIVDDVDNVRTILSTTASSMITVAGVTFSIVIVALSLASSQFGPRLLLDFMRDTGNQVVLGTFVATYVFCLLALRQAGRFGYNDSVPQLSAIFAILLALASLGVLIYFFHHVSNSIQGEEVVVKAANSLSAAIEAHCADRDKVDQQAKPVWSAEKPEGSGVPIEAAMTGYLNVIDLGVLIELAEKHELMIEICIHKGDFIIAGHTLARAYGGDGVDDDVWEKIEESFRLTPRRGTTESLQLAFDRLVEIAVRALSPGINDPFTALACVERLGAGLVLLDELGPVSCEWCDRGGRARVRTQPLPFSEILDSTWGPIRHYGRSSRLVLEKLLEMLELLAPTAVTEERRETLLRHARTLRDEGQRSLTHAWERQRVLERFTALERSLDRP